MPSLPGMSPGISNRRSYGHHRRNTKRQEVEAQETMVALTKLLARQTSATMKNRSPPRKIRRCISNPSSSSEEDTPPSYSKSREGSPSSKEWGVKVYKRNRGLPGNLPGKEPVNSSPSLKDSLTETSVAMLMDIVDVSTIPVDTPNLPVDLPVLVSNFPVDPSVTIPVDTPSLPPGQSFHGSTGGYFHSSG